MMENGRHESFYWSDKICLEVIAIITLPKTYHIYLSITIT